MCASPERERDKRLTHGWTLVGNLSQKVGNLETWFPSCEHILALESDLEVGKYAQCWDVFSLTAPAIMCAAAWCWKQSPGVYLTLERLFVLCNLHYSVYFYGLAISIHLFFFKCLVKLSTVTVWREKRSWILEIIVSTICSIHFVLILFNPPIIFWAH